MFVIKRIKDGKYFKCVPESFEDSPVLIYVDTKKQAKKYSEVDKEVLPLFSGEEWEEVS